MEENRMPCQIHIVLATYNGERYLREQMESILANTWDDVSIEICDDGSDDGTLEIAEDYASVYGHIRVHKNEKNLGYTKNFLEGIKRSESPYVMLCDQDDIWKPDKIAHTYEKMKELEAEYGTDRPLMVYTDAVNFESETGKEQGSFHENSHLNVSATDAAHLLMENKCIGCTVMVNAAVMPYLETVPDEVRVHDWWLALICSFFGKISYLNETTLQYRQHSGNMIGGSGFIDYMKNRLSNLGKQKEALRQTYAQGAAFYALFGPQMGQRERRLAEAFARMSEIGGFRRRFYMLRYRFCKSGWVRNLALFLMI